MSAAPRRPDVDSEWLNHRLAAGEASSTIGFSVELNWTPDIVLAAGSEGKFPRSSRPDNATPTASGVGTPGTDIATTTINVETNPLIISKVSRYDHHACASRGVFLRTLIRSTSATRHSTGSSNTRGLSNSRAQTGTGLGKRGRSPAGSESTGGVAARGCATSCSVMTILSIHFVLQGGNQGSKGDKCFGNVFFITASLLKQEKLVQTLPFSVISMPLV